MQDQLTSHKDISVVFFGSGPVAARSLELLSRTFTIEAVVTKPRPAHHKGPVPVLDLYEQLGSIQLGTLVQVANKAELSQIFAGDKPLSTLGVVIDFGIIITQDVIDSFPLGIINSHFSLLPEWRGADPITFSILSGQHTTGVSLMRITAGLDEGPLLATGAYHMDYTETTPLLTERLIALSDQLLTDKLPGYVRDPRHLFSQETAARSAGRPTAPSYSRKLSKLDGKLDFHNRAVQLTREIRAYTGWPASYTKLAGKDIVITAAHAGIADGHIGQPGEIWQSDNRKQFGFYCLDSSILIIDKLKPAGKQEMTAQAYLNGYGSSLHI